MAKTFEGRLSGEGLSLAIVVSRFNRLVTDRLLAGAREALVSHSVDMDRVPKADWTGTGDWRKLLASKRLEGLKLAPAMKAPPRLHESINAWGQGNFPTDFKSAKPSKFAKPAIPLGGDASGLGIAALLALAFSMKR